MSLATQLACGKQLEHQRLTHSGPLVLGTTCAFELWAVALLFLELAVPRALELAGRRPARVFLTAAAVPRVTFRVVVVLRVRTVLRAVFRAGVAIISSKSPANSSGASLVTFLLAAAVFVLAAGFLTAFFTVRVFLARPFSISSLLIFTHSPPLQT